MIKVMFIDDRVEEVTKQWELSGCESEKKYQLVPIEKFTSVERVVELLNAHNPGVLVVGHGLGVFGINGAEVVRSLVIEHQYKGVAIANSGGGSELFEKDGVSVSGSANRQPLLLKECLDKLLGDWVGIRAYRSKDFGKLLRTEHVKSREREELFKKLCKESKYDEAVKVIKQAATFEEAEGYCNNCLWNPELVPPLFVLEESLTCFVQRHIRRQGNHGGWIHSLSHFISFLWEREMIEWVKKLYVIAIDGAIDLNDYCCLDRLTYGFGHLSRWHDDPSDFGFTSKSLDLIIKNERFEDKLSIARIKAGKFESQEDFEKWKASLCLEE